MLSPQDSNLDRQNQNLQCCHYTRGQWRCKFTNFSSDVQSFFLMIAV